MSEQDRKQPKSEQRNAKKSENPPPAGPHAKPELTNPDATPGSGMLPGDDATEDPNASPSG